MVAHRETRVAQDCLDGGVTDHEHFSGAGRDHLTYLVQPGAQRVGAGPARGCGEQGEDLPRSGYASRICAPLRGGRAEETAMSAG
jgi:hypothetical protein